MVSLLFSAFAFLGSVSNVCLCFEALVRLLRACFLFTVQGWAKLLLVYTLNYEICFAHTLWAREPAFPGPLTSKIGFSQDFSHLFFSTVPWLGTDPGPEPREKREKKKFHREITGSVSPYGSVQKDVSSSRW